MAHCRPTTMMGFVRSGKLDKKEKVVLSTGKVVEEKKPPGQGKRNSKTGLKKGNDTKDRSSSIPTVQINGEDPGIQVKTTPRKFTVRFLGSRSAGKTTLMKTIETEMGVTDKKTNSSAGTVLDETITVNVEGENEAIIRLLDIPDSEVRPNSAVASIHGDEVQPIIAFGEVDLFLVVYSIADFSSVIFARACLRQLKQSSGGMASFNKTPPTVILVANKIDLAPSSSSPQSINFTVSRAEGLNIAKKNCCKFAEVSSTTGLNLSELLAGIVRQLNIRYDVSASSGTATRISRALSSGAFGRFFGLAKTGKCDDLFSP